MNSEARKRSQEIADWNATCPVGTPVEAWPGIISATTAPIVTTTTSKAYLVGCTPVVKVDREAGAIALTHVRVIPKPTATEEWIRADERERIIDELNGEHAGRHSAAIHVISSGRCSEPLCGKPSKSGYLVCTEHELAYRLEAGL